MHVQHFEKGLQMSDRELILIARKIGRLATYCKAVKDAASFIRVETERRDTKKHDDAVKVMITVSLPRRILRAESRKFIFLDAIDRCIEKLESQVERYKDQYATRRRLALRRGRSLRSS